MPTNENVDPQLFDLLSQNKTRAYPVLIVCDSPCDLVKSELDAHGINITGVQEDFNFVSAEIAFQHLSVLTRINGIDWIESDDIVTHHKQQDQ